MSPDEFEMGKPWTEGGVTKFTDRGSYGVLERTETGEHWSKAQVQEGIKALKRTGKCRGHQNIMRARQTNHDQSVARSCI